MRKFSYTIKDENGIHARPAGLLVKEAGKFSSEITIIANEKSADAKKIFALMGLGAKGNSQISVEINGADEEEACRHMEEFLKNNL